MQGHGHLAQVRRSLPDFRQVRAPSIGRAENLEAPSTSSACLGFFAELVLGAPRRSAKKNGQLALAVVLASGAQE
ncbi:MAG: hypothetical protein AB7F83_10100, partial [Lysobacterales bacterium]